MVFWLLIAVTIDRWLSSSTQIHRRQLSTLKSAKRQTIAIIIISLSMHVQVLYCHDANLTTGPFKWYAKDHVCQLVSDLVFAFFTTIPPILCMLVFSLMTVSSICQSQRRVLHNSVITTNQISTTTSALEAQQRAKKAEHQLLLLDLVQTHVLSVFTLSQAIQGLYAVLIALFEFEVSEVQATVDTLFYNIVFLFTYLPSALPFYMYTLGGGSLF